ncbi:MAG: sigma factor [Candidatus Hodarchaeota archaeon]
MTNLYDSYLADMNNPALKPDDEKGKLIHSCLPMVIKLAKTSSSWPEKAHDLILAGNEGLCQCANRYNSNKGKFSVFAYKYIQGYQANFVKRDRTILAGLSHQKDSNLPTTESFNEEYITDSGIDVKEEISLDQTQEEKLIEDEKWKLIEKELNQLRKRKGHRDADIFESVLKGESVKFLSSKYFLSQQRIYAIYDKQLNEIKQELECVINPTKEYMRKLRRRSWDREYRKRNKEKRIIYAREWRKNNPEKFKQSKQKSYQKNRHTKTKYGGRSKYILSEDDVIAIKKHLKKKILSIQQIADMFEVRRQLIYNINAGDTWAHIKI